MLQLKAESTSLKNLLTGILEEVEEDSEEVK
jgi:hypothetical protein